MPAAAPNTAGRARRDPVKATKPAAAHSLKKSDKRSHTTALLMLLPAVALSGDDQ